MQSETYRTVAQICYSSGLIGFVKTPGIIKHAILVSCEHVTIGAVSNKLTSDP
jgi:hypothetical protein